IVAIDGEDRLLRWDARGNPLATWGSGARARAKDGEGPWVHDVGKKPLKIYKANLGTSFDGLLWVQSTIVYDDVVHLACYDRSGSRDRTVMAPVPKSTLVEHRPVIDARGNAYVLAEHLTSSGKEYSVVRVAHGEKRGREWIGPVSRGGGIGSENKMAVAADGTLFLLGSGGRMRRFGPDGRAQWVSKASSSGDRDILAF
ncbi:MAG: hypothetical protein ACXWUG_04655, partial [Polyangiales bacterium]